MAAFDLISSIALEGFLLRPPLLPRKWRVLPQARRDTCFTRFRPAHAGPCGTGNHEAPLFDVVLALLAHPWRELPFGRGRFRRLFSAFRPGRGFLGAFSSDETLFALGRWRYRRCRDGASAPPSIIGYALCGSRNR